jgi:tetratricopeptide (TPR) repeat protein
MPSRSVPNTPSITASSAKRGWQLYRARCLADALTTFNLALATAPEDYSALLGRGRCRRLLGTCDEAIADFTHAHEVRPFAARPLAARPLFERGAIFLLIGRYGESRADHEAAAILEPDDPGSAS